MSFSMVEYAFEEWYFNKESVLPSLISWVLFAVAIAFIILGHFFRIAALFTAQTNFNHRIEFRKR